MIDLSSLKNQRLVGGFLIATVDLTYEPLADSLGREATAETRITGTRFQILIRGGLSERELSVTLYHEILEAATVASLVPPDSVIEFNEGDFERAAQRAFDQLGDPTLPNPNSMLQSFGFRGE